MFQPNLQICLATCHIITCYEHLGQDPWKSFPCSISLKAQWRLSPNKSSHWSKAHQESICCWERGRNLTGSCSSALCAGLMPWRTAVPLNLQLFSSSKLIVICVSRAKLPGAEAVVCRQSAVSLNYCLSCQPFILKFQLWQASILPVSSY